MRLPQVCVPGCIVCCMLLAAGAGRAATYEVGPGLSYPTIASVPNLGPGDVVDIHCGTYNEVRQWTSSGTSGQPITLRGVCVGARPVIDANGRDVTAEDGGPRAAWQIEGSNYAVANLEFINARNGDNGAGLRMLGAGITVSNCKFTQSDMGIMTSAGSDNILIRNSEIAFNGTGERDGLSHNIYLAHGGTITVEYCFIHDAVSGQNVKSRAHYTQLFYNFIADAAESEVEGDDEVDTSTPNSNMTMIGNILVSTPNRTVNLSKFILFGQDLGGSHNGTLYLFNNTLIAGSPSIEFLRSNATNSAIVAANNIFLGSNALVRPSAANAISATNDWVPSTAVIPAGFTNTTTGAAPGFVNSAGMDFHLTADSTARDIGTSALVYLDGGGVSHSGMPASEYVQDLGQTPRVTNGALDAGAYEYVGALPTVAGVEVLFGGAAYSVLGTTRVRLPWQISAIRVTFSKPVASGDTNSLTGVSTTGLSGLGTTVLTWTISPISLGNIALVLAGSGPHALQDALGNSLLGGAGFNLPLRVLWGDFNDDGRVDASDLTLVNIARGQAYNIFADLNGDGVVNLADMRIVTARNGTVLP